MVHSLQSPLDRKETSLYTPKQVTPLTDQETGEALKVLSKNITFTQTDRYYADPMLPNQKIVLVSFIPSSGARPDRDNIYGMMKVRGVFGTEEEANERAEFLIRNVDSYHDIYHAYVGRPFPVTSSEGYSHEVKKIDIRKKTTEVISDDILQKKTNEQREVEEMRDREKQLLDESKAAAAGKERDPFDVYITEQVKRAQLMWTYRETMVKVRQMEKTFEACTSTLSELNVAHPEFVEQYKEKYMKARREAGIPDTDDSFLQFLGTDLTTGIDNLPIIDKLQPEVTVTPIPSTSDEKGET